VTFAVHAPDVTVSGVHHAYDAAPVLHDVSVGINAGQSLALLGPSGCGKTTLLRLIAGLERPLQGHISIGDTCVAGDGHWVPPEQRCVGMVFQDWALFPHLSVEANVAYGLPRSERKGNRVAEALKLVGRATTAGRLGTSARTPTSRTAARRTVLQPRHSTAYRGPHRRPSTTPRTRYHRYLRHPRPRRSLCAW